MKKEKVSKEKKDNKKNQSILDKSNDGSQLDELSKYYESVLKKANILIKENELEKALEILEDELDAPYIPLEYENKFEDLFEQTRAQIKYLSEVEDIDGLNREELFETIFKSKNDNSKMSYGSLLLFFDRFGSSLELSEIKKIDAYLSSKKANNDSKAWVITMLKNAKVDYEFDYFNLYKNQFHKINPTKVDVFAISPYYKQMASLIDDMTEKDPSLNNFCITFLYNIYLYEFPNVPPIDYKNLSVAIFQYILRSLTGKDFNYQSGEIEEYMNKVIPLINNYTVH